MRNIGLKEYVMKKLTRKYEVQSFMAVNGVSFTVGQGDMLGIIGSNGAGKSTLLKVITKIMVPSTGTVDVDGKIAALLEIQEFVVLFLVDDRADHKYDHRICRRKQSLRYIHTATDVSVGYILFDRRILSGGSVPVYISEHLPLKKSPNYHTARSYRCLWIP